MECKAVLENLVAYLDSELDANAGREIGRHLESCPSCHKQAQMYTKTWELLGKLPGIKPSQKNTAQIHERVTAIQGEKIKKISWLRIASLAAAACLIIAVLAYALIPTSKLPDNDSRPSRFSGLRVTITDSNSVTASCNPETVINSIDNQAKQAKLSYLKTVLTNYQSVNDEDYWVGDTIASVSPYLSSDNWKSIE